MKTAFPLQCLVFALLFVASLSIAQPPQMLWSRSYGGSIVSESGKCAIETSDGGFVIAGYSETSAEEIKLMLMKTDANGEVVWFHHPADVDFSGSALSVAQTADGGFIVTGYIYDTNYDRNVFLMKTNASGEMEWLRDYPGAENDAGNGVQQTADGGYLIVATTRSYGAGNDDLWLIKTDANGTQEWNHTYGGDEFDGGTLIQPTSDGGFIITGYCSSTENGRSDAVLLKVNTNCEIEWYRLLGRPGYAERGYAVIQTSDGGYAITGSALNAVFTETNVFLIRTDSEGDLIFDQQYLSYADVHRENNDVGYSLVQDQNGAFVITGSTDPNYIGSVPRAWIMKVDPVGTKVWIDYYDDFPNSGCIGSSIVRTQDGGYAIAGTMDFRRGYYHYNRDVALVRLDSDTSRFLLTMIPPVFPQEFPAEGGFFRFDGIVFNSLAAPQLGQVWAVVTTPDNQDFSGPPMPYFHVMFQPGEPVYRLNMQQNVPAYAPAGEYTYKLCVGIYPNHVLSQSSFVFYKTGLASGNPDADNDPASGWGWENPEVVAEPVGDFTLESISPNPFNSAATVTFTVPEAGEIALTVYNALGQQVVDLSRGWMAAGRHTVVFDGSSLASGIYFVQLRSATGRSDMRKIVLMK